MHCYKLIGALCLSITMGWASERTLTIQSRVINGDRVSSTDTTWQFIVALKRNNAHYCGGSLIASRWVLTAAHCLVDSNNNVRNVVNADSVGIGSYNLDSMTEYAVKGFMIHPDYNADTMDNDIGLIELSSDVSSISPVGYDTNLPLLPDTQTKVAGWGNMSSIGESYPTNLQEAIVPIIARDRCNVSTSYRGDVTANMICAGYLSGGRDGCQGDSGGPLIVDNTVVGIVSWGFGCGYENYPGIYTKVQNYTSWIKSYVPETPSLAPVIMDDIMIFVPHQR